ncbi:MAG: hypothetical protein M4579_004700 [Chaenotheca gracillima]|nr:MAG: hypothetical protein M4579_004700 [Chaenotheca gracillima]
MTRRSSSAVGLMESRTSSVSTMSCNTATNPSVSDSLSITPPTSTTDTASVSVDASHSEEAYAAPQRVRRTRQSLVTTYNENVLSAATRRRASSGGGSRAISGETLVDNSENRRTLDQGINTLNLDWGINAFPSDALNKDTASGEHLWRKRSVRSDLMGKAKSKLSKTASVLGKRGREAVTAGKGGARGVVDGLKRRASLRPRTMPQEEDGAEPPPKKAKVSVPDKAKESAPSSKPHIRVRQPKDKLWLAHGLYIGQDRDFDPRLTETKNKTKKASSVQDHEAKQRAMLPLPMFGGQRLLNNGRDFRLPFDVYSPLPRGQPKPDEWRKTRKIGSRFDNVKLLDVFVGDAASFWKNNKLPELSRCVCTPESGCDEECQNRFMFYECDDSNCNVGAERCTNRSFGDLKHRCKAGGKYDVGVEVIKTEDRGYGVRSNRTFQPNQIIVEYAGEIITQDECDARMKERYKHNECYYLMLFDQNMIIDATRGSIARFVNHACEPNCRMEKWTVAGKPRMALFAGERGIMTGEELTYDYKFDPFSVKNVQECRCGSSNCRGVLGPKPKEAKTMLNTLVGHAKATKRKFQEALAGDGPGPRQKLAKKPRIAPENSSNSSRTSLTSKSNKKTSTTRAKSVIKKRVNTLKKSSVKTPKKSATVRGPGRIAITNAAASIKRHAQRGRPRLGDSSGLLLEEKTSAGAATSTKSSTSKRGSRVVRNARASITSKVRSIKDTGGARTKSIRVVT